MSSSNHSAASHKRATQMPVILLKQQKLSEENPEDFIRIFSWFDDEMLPLLANQNAGTVCALWS
jgi:hypothetical protein